MDIIRIKIIFISNVWINAQFVKMLKLEVNVKKAITIMKKKCKLLTNETREKMVENCLEIDDNFNCKKCVDDYGFIQTNTKACLKFDEELVNYYSKNNGVNYYPCSSINANWTKCLFNLTELRVKGIECIDNLVLLDKKGGLCLTKEEIEQNPKYYFKDETHDGVCSKDIELCLSCNSANDCTQCLYKNYVFDNYLFFISIMVNN